MWWQPRWGRRWATVLVAVTLAAGCSNDPGTSGDPVQRVLIVSVPGITWDDVTPVTAPNLYRIAGRGGVGNMATRVGRSSADNVGAYLTMGAGTRAVASGDGLGVAVAPGEVVNGVATDQLLGRRLGRPPTGIAYVAAGPVADENDETVFGAEVGLLGDELSRHGVRRAVVANADQIDELDAAGAPDATTTMHREAIAMLMDGRGEVPEGDVSSQLLVADPLSPFGVRLDPERVVEAFREAWRTPDERAVVLVEASDLRRVDAYRHAATAAQARGMHRTALTAADDLVGRLLDAVDPATDAVLVVGTPTEPTRPELAMAALAAPGIGPGLLRSATTRRDGYVQLADVAPTVLRLLGEEHPGNIEGRPFTVVGEPGHRVSTLAGDIGEAAFRDRMVPPVTVGFIAVLAALAAAARWWSPTACTRRRLLRLVAYSILGATMATFLAGAAWASPSSVLPYTAFVVACGLAVGVAALAGERRRAGLGAVVALGALVAVVVVDVAVGSTLQLNTVFGYSVAVAGRFAGLGNLAFALLSAATVLLAALLADRFGPAGIRAGIALMVVVVLVDGLPLLGADVGGSLAMVPAFSLTALLLLGRRVDWRHLVALAASGLLVTFAFALVDLGRPDDSQTHLARFARLVLDGNWSSLFDSVLRRFQASFGSVETVSWGVLVLGAVLTGAYVALRDRRLLPWDARRVDWPQPVTAAAAGLAMLGVLGWTTNDSSFAVPATMLIVVVPVLVDDVLRRREAAL